MHSFLVIPASLAAFAFTPPIALADTVVIVEPQVETWVMQQPPGPAVTVEEKIMVGETLPDSVEIVEVPDYDDYGYAYVNQHRVVVDAETGEIIAIY